MSHKHRRTALSVLAGAGALLLLGSALSLAPGRHLTRDEEATDVIGADPEAELQPKHLRPLRRMRTSLSLPYFSFAQSLNPRS